MNQYVIAALIGLVSGVTSGMFGVGGGVVMVPAMLLFMGIKDTKVAVATSLAVIVPTAIMGAWKHHLNGFVQWRTVMLLVPTALVGGYIGVWITTMVSSDTLKRGFGALLLMVSIKLLFLK